MFGNLTSIVTGVLSACLCSIPFGFFTSRVPPAFSTSVAHRLNLSRKIRLWLLLPQIHRNFSSSPPRLLIWLILFRPPWNSRSVCSRIVSRVPAMNRRQKSSRTWPNRSYPRDGVWTTRSFERRFRYVFITIVHPRSTIFMLISLWKLLSK